jgi:hypothetical protein
MQIGQNVRITAIPESVVDAPGFPTRSILSRCIGKVFPVRGFQGDLLAIDVGEVLGKASYLETIYVEAACVEEVSGR